MWKPMEDSSLLHLLGIHKSLPNEIPTKAAATEGGAYLFGWGAKGHPSFCGDLGNSRHLRQLLYMGGLCSWFLPGCIGVVTSELTQAGRNGIPCNV
jgi:hypothetical protein